MQGRRPADDELLITSGAIEALELVAKTFLDRGDIVVVEGPTYLGAIMAFRGYDAELVAVPMDEHGLEVDELERRLADGVRPKLLYTIPDHQNPAGVSMSSERRERLVELARRHGFLIVEDVAYRELAFDGDALPSLWSLAPDAVVQAGRPRRRSSPACGSGGPSGRRRSPRSSSRRSRTPISAPARSGSGSSRSTCAVAGSRSSSCSRARSTGASRERMLAALERSMPAGTTWTRRRAGSSRGSRFPRRRRGGARAACGRAGVGSSPARSSSRTEAAADNVRLSFSMVDEERIDEGIELLASLVRTEEP